ncbi:MAG: hypothetical protein LBK99_24470 [Opitutaceae bacterium]|jgi:hypothetical protein|nr:hypothetical protein [Opitutaceae bacterium]
MRIGSDWNLVNQWGEGGEEDGVLAIGAEAPGTAGILPASTEMKIKTLDSIA